MKPIFSFQRFVQLLKMTSIEAIKPLRKYKVVFLGKQSHVWQQALNRVHVQKSILLYCFGKLLG